MTMDVLSLFTGLLIIYLLIRMLHLTSQAEEPKLFYRKPTSPFILNLLELCPILTAVYSPTSIWGKSGHFQTCVHAKIGRTKPKRSDSQRFFVPMPDGATMSFDVFNPKDDGNKARFTLAICPGIANSSECIYIGSFATYAQSHGYRVAVLNHIGALKTESLTSPRIFTYGGTDEYSCMIERLIHDYPGTKILAVGFSMGGNIVTKYLGENRDNQAKVLCGASICQGYEANKAKDHFSEWAQLRCLYTYGMTIKQRRLLERHRAYLFSEEAKQSFKEIDERKVFSATSLLNIDESYSCYRAGFANVKDYYDWASSAYTMQNIIIPMLYMNAEDDPLIPPPLFIYPRETAEKSENCIFITTKHGGHLGFFEGGRFVPDAITWLDRFVIEYADAVINLYKNGKLPVYNSLINPDELSFNKLQSDNNESTITDSFKSMNSEDVIRTANRRNVTKEEEFTSKEEEKGGSLKRGSILKQATSYVQ